MNLSKLMLMLLLASSGTPVFAQEHAELFQSYTSTPEKKSLSKISDITSGGGLPVVERASNSETITTTGIFGQTLTEDAYGETPSKKQAAKELYSFMANPELTKVRGGGNSGKPLGVYREGCKNVEFHSKEYVELDPHVKAHWAVFLYTIIESYHGGWQSTLGNRFTDPVAATYVDFPKMDSAAAFFFQSYHDEFHDPGGRYAALPGMYRAWFRSDAILDAVNMIGAISYAYAKDDNERKAITAWTTGTIDRYERQIGPEGHVETLNPLWKPPPPDWYHQPHPMHFDPSLAPPGSKPYVDVTRHRRPTPLSPGTDASQPGNTTKFPFTEPPIDHNYGNSFPSTQGEGMKHLDELLKRQGQ